MGRWALIGVACAAALLSALLVRGADAEPGVPESVARMPKGSTSGEAGSGRATLAQAPVDARVEQRAALDVEPEAESADVDADATRSGADVAGGISVEGRVLDPNGQPVAGASIVIHRPRNAPEPTSTLRTGPDGRFSVAGAWAGTRIGARMVGWAPTFAVVLRPDCAREIELELRFDERPGTLRGVVVDPRGAPVASALVVVEEAGPDDGWIFQPIREDAPLLPQGCQWSRSVGPVRLVTDEGGAFEVPDALPGRAEVKVTAENRLDAKEHAEIEHGAVTAFRVELADGATLVGRATWPDGSPVKKKQIRLRRTVGFRSSTRVDSPDGSFRFEGLPAGELSVRVAWLSRGSAQADVTLVDGRETRCDLVLQKHVDLEGTLVAETGEPLADWIVTARGPSNYSRRRRSDESGRFELDGVAPLADRLEIRPRSSGLGEHVALVVDPWSSPRPLRLVVPSQEVPGSTVRFSIDPPAADADATFVRLVDEREGHRRIEGDGTCVAEELPAGRYRLFIEADGWHASTTLFELQAREDLDLGVLTRPDRGEVDLQVDMVGRTEFERGYSCRLLAANGVEIDTVYLNRPNVPVGPLPAGRYRLVSEAPFLAPLDVEFDVVAGETRVVEVELVPATSRRFRIHAVPSTREVGALTFRLLDANGVQVRSRPMEWNAAVGDEGIGWREPSLVPGRYTLEVHDDAGRTARVSFTVEQVDRPAEPTPTIPLTLRAP
ncbi:MAG: carboxypeptidase-like regulatory domain-containing protein [Planctomycetota bacterium]